MNIPPFIQEYIPLVSDEHIIKQIRHLAVEYAFRSSPFHPAVSKYDIQKEFIGRVRIVVEPYIKDVAAYDQVVRRQDKELEEMK